MAKKVPNSEVAFQNPLLKKENNLTQHIINFYYNEMRDVGTNELVHEISNNVVCETGKASDQSAHKCSLIRAFASHLNILGVLSC